MATKRQIEEQDRASETRRAEAVGAIIAHADSPPDARGAAVGVLSALADAIDGEAADVGELRRKGWQSAMKAHVTTAEVVRTWRDLLVEYAPPAGMPAREPADIARDHRADTPAELEQRLVDAFGPELAPVRHIRTVIEHTGDDSSDPSTYGPLCNATTGSFTHPGGANCEECHRIYADQQGRPYDGPMAHGNEIKLTVSEGGDLAERNPIQEQANAVAWVDGPVTPEVARAMRAAGPFTAESNWPVEARSTDGNHPDGVYGMDTSALDRINALPDASITAQGTFDAAPPVMADGDAISIAMPDGGTITGTVQNVRTDGQDVTADVAAVQFAMNSELGAADKVSPPDRWPREVDGSPSPSTVADVAALNIVEPTTPQVRPRMSAAQVREHAMRRASGAQHRSISQVEGFSDCGTRYALRDLERPAWWNVGGKALHRAVETINRWAAVPGAAVSPTEPAAQEDLFLQALDQEIADQHAATPEHPMSTWRAAKRGAEHYDWWRVEGPIMVQRWVAWLSRMLADGWTIATAPINDNHKGAPIIEFETRLDVGIPVPNLSIIDLALLHPRLPEIDAPCLLVVDAKAGGSAPKDTFQLGVYGWSLLAAGVAGFMPRPDLINVRGAYWRARTGEAHPAYPASIGWPILSIHTWPDVVQRYRDMDAMERQGIYMPNVTSFCGGCGVADLCPAKATA